MSGSSPLSDRLRAAVLASSLATAAVVGAVPEAKAQSSRTVAVGIIDIGADHVDFDDPNVRFVNLTPKPPEGRHFSPGEENKTQHGVVVASAFVREYRKLDPEAQIVFYSVNPFVRKLGETNARFDAQAVKTSLPVMKAAGVKVVISSFGVADQEAGERIAGWFKQQNLVLFAATPNDPRDPGIYPAALSSTISVADSNRNSGLWKDPTYKRYVDFTIDGEFVSRHTESHGSSFSSGKVAAYGAFIANAEPEMGVESIRGMLRYFAAPYKMGDVQLHAVGGKEMIASMVEAHGAPPRDVPLNLDVVRGRRAAGAAVAMASGGAGR